MNQFFGQEGVIELDTTSSCTSTVACDSIEKHDADAFDVIGVPSSVWKSITFARGTFGEISMALFCTNNDSRYNPLDSDDDEQSNNNHHHKKKTTTASINTLRLVAIKTIAIPEEHTLYTNGHENNTCQEVEVLRQLQSNLNIISLLAVYPSSTNRNELKIVTEYCPIDLYMSLEWRRRRRRHNAIVQQPLSLSTIQCIMYDIFNALQYIHTKLHLVHNDLKPGNILISSWGVMKLCDFGLVQKITTTSNDNEPNRTSQPYQRHRTKGMTTLNYRSPEVLLGDTCVLPSVDMYAAGVIFAELLLLPSSSTTLFHGTTEMEQLQQICHILGTPNIIHNHWPEYQSLPYGQHFTFQQIYPAQDVTEFIPRCWENDTPTNDTCTDLLRHILVLDPHLRWTSTAAFEHGWFHNIHENERQRRLLVQEELIPPELIEPIIISDLDNVLVPDDRNHDCPPTISISERDSIVLAKVQAFELATKRRVFLADLDHWMQQKQEIAY